ERRQNSKARKGEIEIEIADRLDQVAVEPDLLMCFAQRSRDWRLIIGIDLAAWKRNLPGVARQRGGAQGQQHGRLRMIDDRYQHGSRTRRCDAGALPHFRIEVEIATRGRRRMVGQRCRHVESEAGARALEEVDTRPFTLQHLRSSISSAGAIANKAPPEPTPNIRTPSTSRSSPRSTRSKNSARFTRAHRFER